MKRYTFTQQKLVDVLASGKAYVYFDEREFEETISRKDMETGEESTETHMAYSYRRAELEAPLDKAKIVNAIIREDYSQDAVEAIFRHKFNGDAGADAEFEQFNLDAENAKARANEIMQVL